MSQLKNLDMIHIDESSTLGVIQGHIDSMKLPRVEREIAIFTKQKTAVDEKLKWWRSLSDEEKDKEKNKSLIKTFTIGTVSTLAAGLIGALVFMHLNDKKYKVMVLRDYELELNKISKTCEANLELLEKRKKELNSAKHESSILSNLDNVKIV
ncbi:MAG: hypothetical protein M0P49_05255 [Bacilli bacterium]|nr:hypothetical protein [Bacilli bacterium]